LIWNLGYWITTLGLKVEHAGLPPELNFSMVSVSAKQIVRAHCMKRFVQGLVVVSIPVLLILGLAEALLRLSPSLIGLALLERFPDRLKSEIATTLGLPSKAAYNIIASASRQDNGSDLYLPLPNASYFTPAEPADKAAGAIESFTVDALGYCNPREKAAGTPPKILVLGGSVPSCAGVDAQSVFSAQLGEVTGLATYDMTVGGVGPNEYVEVLRRDGLALRPKIVVRLILRPMTCATASDIRTTLPDTVAPAANRESGASLSHQVTSCLLSKPVLKSWRNGQRQAWLKISPTLCRLTVRSSP